MEVGKKGHSSYPDSTAILCHSYPPCNRESINYILDVG